MPFQRFMKKRKGFIFTNKKNSNRAVMAVILGIISLASLGTAVFSSYKDNGAFEARYGVVALLAAVYSLVGAGLGIAAASDKDNYRLFPVLGILLNALTLAGLCLILYMGANVE